MQNRLFANNDKRFLTIDAAKFFTAAEQSDSATIDAILEARKNGYELDINKELNGKTALEILVEKHDLKNASKLIQAGAKTQVPYKVWVDDDGPYPYGGFETRHRNVFDKVNITKEDLLMLAGKTDSDECSSAHARNGM